MKSTNYKNMKESEKILSVLDVLGAVSPETAVTTESMIDKAIELGMTEDVFTENWHGHKEGDHPWWLLLAAMSGTGSEDEVAKNDCPHLHRQRIASQKNGRKTNVFVYWYDESKTHTIHYTGKAYQDKVQKMIDIKEFLQRTKNAPTTMAEARQKMETNPEYVKIGEKFVQRDWLKAHHSKAMNLYGGFFQLYPEIYKELYGEQ